MAPDIKKQGVITENELFSTNNVIINTQISFTNKLYMCI
jgi:hypothetical protein